MSLSTVAITSMLVVGFIIAGSIALQSLTLNVERVIEGFENLNEINSKFQNVKVSIGSMTVSAIDGTFNIEILNEGQNEIKVVHIMIDGKLVAQENGTIFPYEKRVITVPLEKANLRRGSRIKVIADGFSAYKIYG
jgi:archaellum component FlaF (FlaF/FlaG flagellin family)